MTVEQFMAEVRAFDRAFLNAMAERVRTITERGGLPDVAIDLHALADEQRDRSGWLANALKRTNAEVETQWSAARKLLSSSVFR